VGGLWSKGGRMGRRKPSEAFGVGGVVVLGRGGGLGDRKRPRGSRTGPQKKGPRKPAAGWFGEKILGNFRARRIKGTQGGKKKGNKFPQKAAGGPQVLRRGQVGRWDIKPGGS